MPAPSAGPLAASMPTAIRPPLRPHHFISRTAKTGFVVGGGIETVSRRQRDRQDRIPAHELRQGSAIGTNSQTRRRSPWRLPRMSRRHRPARDQSQVRSERRRCTGVPAGEIVGHRWRGHSLAQAPVPWPGPGTVIIPRIRPATAGAAQTPTCSSTTSRSGPPSAPTLSTG